MNGDETLVTQCECTDPSHMMAFRYLAPRRPQGDLAEPELYVSVQLNQRYGFWGRVWKGLGYVLGRKSRYGDGHWDEGAINLKSAIALQTLLTKYITVYNDYWEAARKRRLLVLPVCPACGRVHPDPESCLEPGFTKREIE